MKIAETINAAKVRLDETASLKIARSVKRIISMKGKSVRPLNVDSNTSDEEILDHIMGPTGNLRAPTAIVGKTMYVGFNPDVYAEHGFAQ